MGDDGGFINPRTGKYVSSMRAHQHVGESIKGYEKAISKSTGNFYMRPTSAVGSYGLSNPFLEIQVAALEAQAMQTYASLYVDAMNKAIESLNRMTRNMEIDNAESEIRRTYEAALKNISTFETVESLGDKSGALEALKSLIPEDQIELFKAAGSLEDLKRNCNYVLRVLDKGKSKLRDLERKKDSSIEKDDVEEKARTDYYRLDSIRSSRREAFKAMRRSSAGSQAREDAITTFWQTVDAELAIIDESAWRQKKFEEACLLVEYGAYEQAAELLSFLGDYPGAEDKLQEVECILAEFESIEKYDEAKRLLSKGDYKQAIEAFESLGDWNDSQEQLCVAKQQFALWQKETYSYAAKHFDDGDFKTAYNEFRCLGDYLDSKHRAKESRELAKKVDEYESAIALEKKGDFVSARDAFKKLGPFRDSSERATSCQNAFEDYQRSLYKDASADLSAGRFKECIKKLKELGDYSDSKALLEQAKALLAQKESLATATRHFKDAKYAQAKKELEKPHMSDHADAAKMLKVIREIEQKESARSSLMQKKTSATEKRDKLKKDYSRAKSKKRPKVASQIALEKAEKNLKSLQSQLDAAGLFAFSAKKELRASIEKEQANIALLKGRIPKEQSQRDADIAANLRSIQDRVDESEKELRSIGQSISQVEAELRKLRASY